MIHTENDDEEFLQQHIGSQSGCPPLAMLRAQGQGVLSAEVEQSVTVHLQECGLCTMLLEDLATLPEPSLTDAQQERIFQSVQNSSQIRRAQGERDNLRHSIGRIAAIILLAAGIFAGYRILHRARSGPSLALSPNPVETPPVTLAIVALPPPQGIVSALTMRGAGETDDPSTAELLTAFTPYNHGQYAEAAKQFSSLSATYPHSDLVDLYLGVSQLLLNQNEAALTTLSHAQGIASPANKEAIAWYRAAAALRAKSPDSAALFHAICNNPESSYASQGCQIDTALHAASH